MSGGARVRAQVTGGARGAGPAAADSGAFVAGNSGSATFGPINVDIVARIITRVAAWAGALWLLGPAGLAASGSGCRGTFTPTT